jgi:site-specific recombinase XerD
VSEEHQSTQSSDDAANGYTRSLSEPDGSDSEQGLHPCPQAKQDANSALDLCFEMFMLHQEASHHTPRTLGFYTYTLQAFIAFLTQDGVDTPEGVTRHHIRQFMVHKQREGCTNSTVHGYARAVKTFLNFLVDEDVLGETPMQSVTMPKLEEKVHPAFTQEDIRALLDACQGPLGKRDRAIMLCLLDSGLRASEFVSMDVGDVDKDGMVRVAGKGQKERYVRLGATARKAMLRYLYVPR